MANNGSDNPDDKFARHRLMADAIVKITKATGSCKPEDLVKEGFTLQEALARWNMASAMAAIELELGDK